MKKISKKHKFFLIISSILLNYHICNMAEVILISKFVFRIINKSIMKTFFNFIHSRFFHYFPLENQKITDDIFLVLSSVMTGFFRRSIQSNFPLKRIPVLPFSFVYAFCFGLPRYADNDDNWKTSTV